MLDTAFALEQQQSTLRAYFPNRRQRAAESRADKMTTVPERPDGARKPRKGFKT